MNTMNADNDDGDNITTILRIIASERCSVNERVKNICKNKMNVLQR